VTSAPVRDLPAARHNPSTGADGITLVGIVIPARNEQARLGRCLDAIAAAIADLQRTEFADVAVQTVVVLDRCTDRTADVAARYGQVRTITADLGNVGSARAVGVRTLMSASAQPRQQVWLANTDADSTVPVSWLTKMLEHAHRGADLVLGTVTPDALAPRRLRRAWAERHDTQDGHPHIHAANLGIRASTYLTIGGWPELVSGEDASLVHSAELNLAVRILRSGTAPVITSSRLNGRAPHGFAHYLHRLAEQLEQPTRSSIAAQS
jgi:glycosyltransferase involved in cell wall biosynthesis